MAVVQAHCEEIGLAEPIIQKLVDSSFDTYAKFAYCSNHIPGAKVEAEFAKSMKTCIGRAPQGQEQAVLRHLETESHNFVTSDMENRIGLGETQPLEEWPSQSVRFVSLSRRSSWARPSTSSASWSLLYG